MGLFSRKKDKRKNGEGGSLSGIMPGFGSSSSKNDNALPKFGSGFHDNGSSWPSASDPRARGNKAVGQFRPMATRASVHLLAKLPDGVLERIFTIICPHTSDESYETCEQSSIEDSCMLCDLRDLANCLAVCRRWRLEGVKRLYHSIRIDSVHYCELEAELAEKRKHRSRFDRNGQSEDTALVRLKLLSRTLREDPVRLGARVQFLKTPYMLRESASSQADFARTIAVTPNLRYIDLPEGMFADEPSFQTLRFEVQARCREVRKMTYMGGSERSLQEITRGTIWPRLEVLELIRIDMDPAVLRQVLGCLGNLRALKISDTTCVGDEVLSWEGDMIPPFPPLEEFVLTNVPQVTADGLKAWLLSIKTQSQRRRGLPLLRVLTLNGTGVGAWSLQEVVAHAPGLKHLSLIDDSVTTAMPAHGMVPPLNSASLETLHYEISPASPSPKFSGVTASYYNYLAGSLLSGGLPNLRAVYVRDPNFPDLLLGLPPPAPAFAGGGIARPSSSHGTSPGGRFGSSPKQDFSPFGSPKAGAGGGGFGHNRQQGSVSSLNGAFGQLQLQPPGFRNSNVIGGGTANPRFSSNNPFANLASGSGLGPGGGFGNLPAKLEVFTKGDDELAWSFAPVNRPSLPSVGGGGGGMDSSGGGGGGRGENGRPLSAYGLGADLMGGSGGWNSGAGARRSVLVGGAGAGGGFLAVPADDGGGSSGSGFGGGGHSRGGSYGGSGSGYGGGDEWPRPRSSAGEKKREKLDLWR